MRLYAIGDVHGQLDMLRHVHDLIAQDKKATGDQKAPVVHLGDYCDRGPRTKEVLDLLIDGVAAGEPWICLKGNHDRMMWLYLQEQARSDHRLRPDYSWGHEKLGGLETLRSYGIDIPEIWDTQELHAQARALVPETHLRFLAGLETHLVTQDLFLCHAGIRPGVALDQQSEDDLLWIRDEFHDDPRDHGKLIVHGHTVVDLPIHAGNRVNLDTGAGYGRPLTAAVFEGRKAWVLTPDGRRDLAPASPAG
jgi:serine/threonine protein phosphatase 1